jgi:hypothetical protein
MHRRIEGFIWRDWVIDKIIETRACGPKKSRKPSSTHHIRCAASSRVSICYSVDRKTVAIS